MASNWYQPGTGLFAIAILLCQLAGGGDVLLPAPQTVELPFGQVIEASGGTTLKLP